VSGPIKNVGSNWAATLAAVAVNYLLTPFLINVLGRDGYGIYMLIMSIAGYLSLLILGVPMASVRYFAEYTAEGDQQKMNETIGSCMGLYAFLGAVALLIGAVLFLFFSWGYNIPPTWHSDSSLAFVLLVLYVSIGFVGILPEGIMHGHHDFVFRNIIVLGVLGIRLGLSIVLLDIFPSLTLLALIQVACLIIDFTASYVFIKRHYKGLTFSFSQFRWEVLRRIFSFSLYVLMLNLGSRLIFYTAPIVIGAFLDLTYIPFYTVANYFLIYLVEFIWGIAAVLMPMATKLETEKRTSELKTMFLKSSKIAFSLTLLSGLYLIVLGPRFIAWWISPSFETPAGVVLQILVFSSLVFLPVRGVAQPILMGLGRVKVPTITFLAGGVVNLVLSLVLVKPLGLPGLAIATAIPILLMGLIMLVFACRVLGVSLFTYARYVAVRASLGAIPLLGLLCWLRIGCEVQGLIGLMVSFLVTVLVFIFVWVFFVFRNDPYIDLLGQLRGLWVWREA
jgi:O-antigen/teichoic acid export membrane protein